MHTKNSRSVSNKTPRLFTATNSLLAFWSRGSPAAGHSQNGNSTLRTTEASLIYAVDDMPCLTELYALVLEAIGHRARTFNNRRVALAALRVEEPALLITDFRNTSMPTDRFLEECVALRPQLRILMASGFGRSHADFTSVKPHRFLQKPFTPEELLGEVRAILAGTRPRGAR